MKRLTKTYEDGTHGVADNLPCGENSYAFKNLLIETIGKYEDTGLTPQEILDDRMLTGWIPVGERLPEKGISVLITTSDGEVASDFLKKNGKWFWGEEEEYKIIAWMPLPEPYRPEAEVESTELLEYHAIGTVEECREAREKQTPKKPIVYPKTNRADCPCCESTVRGISKPFGDWCSHCGQRLDWRVNDI